MTVMRQNSQARMTTDVTPFAANQFVVKMVVKIAPNLRFVSEGL